MSGTSDNNSLSFVKFNFYETDIKPGYERHPELFMLGCCQGPRFTCFPLRAEWRCGLFGILLNAMFEESSHHIRLGLIAFAWRMRRNHWSVTHFDDLCTLYWATVTVEIVTCCPRLFLEIGAFVFACVMCPKHFCRGLSDLTTPL